MTDGDTEFTDEVAGVWGDDGCANEYAFGVNDQFNKAIAAVGDIAASRQGQRSDSCFVP